MVRSDLLSPATESGSLTAAVRWIEALLLGQFATAIAILAVAFLGFQTMSGHLSMRAALRVTFGCFLLFGSSTIARGLIDASQRTDTREIPVRPDYAPQAPLPPARPVANANPFDPYPANPPPN